MRILLDTNLLLWWLTNNARLSLSARDTILSASAVFVSSISLWEVSIKYGIGTLPVSGSEVLTFAQQDGFSPLPFTELHALAVAGLPNIHKDPFDRALVAQSVSEPLILLTSDALLAQYGNTVRVV